MKIFIINTKGLSPNFFKLIEALDVRTAKTLFIKEYYEKFKKHIFPNDMRILTFSKRIPAYEHLTMRRTSNHMLKKHDYFINKKHEKQ